METNCFLFTKRTAHCSAFDILAFWHFSIFSILVDLFVVRLLVGLKTHVRYYFCPAMKNETNIPKIGAGDLDVTKNDSSSHHITASRIGKEVPAVFMVYFQSTVQPCTRILPLLTLRNANSCKVCPFIYIPSPACVYAIVFTCLPLAIS